MIIEEGKEEKLKEELIKELRENTTREDFMRFTFEWFGDSYMMELLEESIDDCDDIESLELVLKKLKEGTLLR